MQCTYYNAFTTHRTLLYIKTAYYVRRTKTPIYKRIYIYNILYHSLIVYNILYYIQIYKVYYTTLGLEQQSG